MMRIGSLLLAVLLAGAIPARAQLTIAPPASGLQAAYALSNGIDASGHGRTGILTNTTVVPGKYAEAQRFNGSSSRITIPSFDTPSGFTVESWVWLTAATARLIPSPRTGASGWSAIVYHGLDAVFLAEVGDGFISAGFTTPAGIVNQIVSPSKITIGAWHHIAVAYGGTTLLLAIDGVQVAAQTVTGGVLASTQPWELGGSARDQGWLNGLLDDVRIYDRALTLPEINADLAVPVDTVREAVVSWEMEVWPRGSAPGTAGAVGVSSYPKAAALCDLAPTAPGGGAVVNPTKARLADPELPARECELIIQTLIEALPVGLGYTTTVRAHGMSTASDRSGASNPFDRVAEAIPPLSPGAPVVR